MPFKIGDTVRTDKAFNLKHRGLTGKVVDLEEYNYVYVLLPGLDRPLGFFPSSLTLVEEFPGMKVRFVKDLTDYAVREHIERHRVYLYVHSNQGFVSVITARTPLVLRSPFQTYGYKYEGSDEQAWVFRSEARWEYNGTTRTDWHHASDAGVRYRGKYRGPNFLLDPSDLFDEGILANDNHGKIYTPEVVANLARV